MHLPYEYSNHTSRMEQSMHPQSTGMQSTVLWLMSAVMMTAVSALDPALMPSPARTVVVADMNVVRAVVMEEVSCVHAPVI